MKIQSQRYRSWWSSAEETKHKGSGVGILVDKNWANHLTEIQRPNAYSIRVSFRFRKAQIVVWVVYLPPNDNIKQMEVQRLVTKDIASKKGNTQFIVGGDFNRILDQNLDTTNSQSRGRKPHLPLIKWIKSLGFAEAFRVCNPYVRKYTWANSSVQTRIDQIWISSKVKEGLTESDIEEMSLVTGSDHNLVWGRINTASFISYDSRNRSKANIRNIPKRKIFLYKEASEENWEEYKNMLESSLFKDCDKNLEEIQASSPTSRSPEEFINEE
jgi:exonuclease III